MNVCYHTIETLNQPFQTLGYMLLCPYISKCEEFSMHPEIHI